CPPLSSARTMDSTVRGLSRSAHWSGDMPSQVGALVFRFPRTAIRIWRYSFIEAGYSAASVFRAPLDGLLLPLRLPLPFPLALRLPVALPFPLALCLPFLPFERAGAPWLDGSSMRNRCHLASLAFSRCWMPLRRCVSSKPSGLMNGILPEIGRASCREGV